MRRAALAAAVATTLAALTSGCGGPTGEERRGCNASWLDAPSITARGIGASERALRIECIDPVGPRRVEVGFELPAGPDCWVLKRVELRESADAVSIVAIGAISAEPNAGACAEEPRRVVTELDLASRVADRALLDGSVSE